jgi:two-component system OmpR family response regulator
MPDHAYAKVLDLAQPRSPRVLVADDDAASCRFLCDALRSLGMLARPSHDGFSALGMARAEKFDLLLLDCRMPGAGARQILASLREEAHAASTEAVAVATSADMTATDRQALLTAGFARILLKPCTVADLEALLRQLDIGTRVVLDDRAGLDSSGDAATMQALRGLLHAELVQLIADLDMLENDRAALAERLHRLRSSCGFCGAAALSQQTVLLQGQLASDAASASLQPFRAAVQATLVALDV